MIFLRKQRIETITNYVGMSSRKMPVLTPTDEESWSALEKLKDGTVVATESKRARNVQHHKKLFKLLSIALENQQTDFPTVEALLDAIKIETGHAELRKKLSGETYWAPKSISFHSMGQEKFAEFYDKALDLICQHVMPGTDRNVLEREMG